MPVPDERRNSVAAAVGLNPLIRVKLVRSPVSQCQEVPAAPVPPPSMYGNRMLSTTIIGFLADTGANGSAGLRRHTQ